MHTNNFYDDIYANIGQIAAKTCRGFICAYRGRCFFNESHYELNLSTLDVYVIVTDNVSMKSVVLYYRIIGDSKYKHAKMSSNGGKVAYDFHAVFSKIKNPGIEYYFQVEDTAGNLRLHGNSITPLVMYAGNQWLTQKISRNGGHSSYIGLSFGSDVNKVSAGFEYV